MSEQIAKKLNVSLPVPQGYVKPTVEQLLITLEQIHQAEQSVKGLLKIVRDGCSHPEKIKVSHTGKLFLRCTTCGREW